MITNDNHQTTKGFFTNYWKNVAKNPSWDDNFQLQYYKPWHKQQGDQVVEQSSFSLIAFFWLKIGRCRGQNWLYGNKALSVLTGPTINRQNCFCQYTLNQNNEQSNTVYYL